MEDSFTYNNEDEAGMGSILALHLNMNAIAAVQARMPTGPSLDECEDCGEEIPENRKIAVPGCSRCIHCQSVFERTHPV